MLTDTDTDKDIELLQAAGGGGTSRPAEYDGYARRHVRKRRYYAFGGLIAAGILVLGLYAFCQRGAPDGSFLADLGRDAEDAYNLGVTDPEEYVPIVKQTAAPPRILRP